VTFLLLHGFTGLPESWAPVGLEDAFAPPLPGHGLDPSPVGSFDDTVEQLLETAPPGAHLVGYSLGGRLAQAMAARAPRRFASLTVIGAHPGLRDEPARSERRRSDAGWARRLRRDGLEAFVDAWEALPLWASQAGLPAAVLATQRAARLAHRAEALAEALTRLGLAEMPSYHAFWERPPLPARRLVGALDAPYRTLYADGPMTLVEGAGHNVVLERPVALRGLLLGGS
jgi:2-succinyl-6-hydroxy-2,4-cyclohexadiene-1-carboxylate synthase